MPKRRKQLNHGPLVSPRRVYIIFLTPWPFAIFIINTRLILNKKRHKKGATSILTVKTQHPPQPFSSISSIVVLCSATDRMTIGPLPQQAAQQRAEILCTRRSPLTIHVIIIIWAAFATVRRTTTPRRQIETSRSSFARKKKKRNLCEKQVWHWRNKRR